MGNFTAHGTHVGVPAQSMEALNGLEDKYLSAMCLPVLVRGEHTCVPLKELKVREAFKDFSLVSGCLKQA